MKISVCMIVWNEAKIIHKAIESVQGLADEIVIVDTGSTDDTINVCERLGCKVFTGADRYHKAQSRNKAINNASGDWIVILDADETIAQPKELRKYLETSKAQAIYIRLAYVDSQDNHTLEYAQMRVWRKGTYEYKYRAHEIPVAIGGVGKVEYTNFVWQHRPQPNRGWKLQYTLDRLLLDYEENPDSSRTLFYLARQYTYMKQWQKAIELFKRLVSEFSNTLELSDAWFYLSRCYGELGNKKEQKASLFRACQEFPNRREYWGTLAELYRADGQNVIASALLQSALEMNKPTTGYVDHKWYGAHIHDVLARSYWSIGKYKEGREQARIAVLKSPNEKRLIDNLAYFERKLNNGKNLLSGFDIKLNVLLIAIHDFGGVANRIQKALNANGCNAKAVTYKTDYLCYEKDIFRPTDNELADLISWADVIHVFDNVPDVLGKLPKPTIITYNGSYYRSNPYGVSNRHRELGIDIQLCTTIDLTQYGAEWMPIPIEVDGECREKANTSIRIIHCPTNRHIKRTNEVVESLSGFDLDIVEGLSNFECLERKRKSDVLIDQFDLGYGLNALEAWSIGIPVISDANETITNMIKAKIGFLPYVKSQPSQLKEVVEKMRNSSEYYQDAACLGNRYLNTWHNPTKIANFLIEKYRNAIDGIISSTI